MAGFQFPAKPPAKKSLFERQRAEAEAKRQREAAETAAVYEEFVKSFSDGGDRGGGGPPLHAPRAPQAMSIAPTAPTASIASTAPTAPTASTAPHLSQIRMGSTTVGTAGGRRHFSMRGSGGVFGAGGSTALKKRRPLSDATGKRLGFGEDDEDEDGDERDDDWDGRDGDRAEGDREEGEVDDGDDLQRKRGLGGGVASTVDRRAEAVASAKPTLRLANLPPGTSPAAVRALVVGGSNLTVDSVRMLPSTSAGLERKAAAAIVVLATETAASDMDAAVTALKNRYLGYGYYLTLHRHLSSAVVVDVATGSVGAGGLSARPFGARPVPPPPKPGAPSGGNVGFAPPPPAVFLGHGSGYGRGRGIPPPTASSNMIGQGFGGPLLHVPVRPPRDIKQLRMIHKVLENVLDQGPAFEALLMSRPEVQTEEKWAWLWDARSEAGVWYRYRLWETVTGGYGLGVGGSTGDVPTSQRPLHIPLFEDSSAWKTPDAQALPFEFVTSVDELVSDGAYDSSDQDSDEDEGGGATGAAAGAGAVERNDAADDTFLNPLAKARLTHLLARLPTTLARLRKGDIARVTAFVLAHANRGADEAVELLVGNVERPLALTRACPQTTGQDRDTDDPGAQLVAVYAISDVLGASASSGIRHAWRFRQLIESALRRRHVFAALGRLATQRRWGRLRADKWKRSIGLVLSLWESWSVFAAETHEALVNEFADPPPLDGDDTPAEDAAAAADASTDRPGALAVAVGKRSRWKTVDTATERAAAMYGGADLRSDMTVEGDAARPVRVNIDADTDSDADAGADPDANANANVDDEWAYQSEYTDDEALDQACLDAEDIDGAPMDVDEDALAAYLDGVPLTDAEMNTLLGGGVVAEVSEEGEIGSDDDVYALSGLSSLSSESETDVDMGVDVDAAMVDVDATVLEKAARPTQCAPTSMARPPRAQRTRAVDLFVDADVAQEGRS